MNLPPLLALGALIVVSPFPVHALDCGKASLPVEKLICATPELKKADAAMSAAYFKLLQETTAPEFREAMIRSQRRWLAVRSRGLERFGAAENEATDDHEALLIMTRDRLTFFETATPIRAMEQQRKITSKDSGGSFAGFNTSSCFSCPHPMATGPIPAWAPLTASTVTVSAASRWIGPAAT